MEKEDKKMNNTVKILTLVSIFSLFLFGTSAFAENGYGYSEATTETYHSMGWNTFEASALIGQTVYTPFGRKLGHIEDFMIDRNNGGVVLAIISDVPGFGEEFVAAPFSSLDTSDGYRVLLNFGDHYTLNPPSDLEDPYAYQLYRDRAIVRLFTIPSTIDPLWADSVYQLFGQTPYWTEGRTPHPDIMSYRAVRSPVLESLIMGKTAPVLTGATAESKDGKAAARIDDLVIDSKDGRVAFLVLDHVPGRSDSEVAVPFNELSMSGDVFVLNTTQEQLVSAPSFNESADMNDLRYAENVYRFFGQQPYWTEKGMR